MAISFEPHERVILVQFTKIGAHEIKAIHSIHLLITVNGLIFAGYKVQWFSWRVTSTNSSIHEIAIVSMNYEGKLYDHVF